MCWIRHVMLETTTYELVLVSVVSVDRERRKLACQLLRRRMLMNVKMNCRRRRSGEICSEMGCCQKSIPKFIHPSINIGWFCTQTFLFFEIWAAMMKWKRRDLYSYRLFLCSYCCSTLNSHSFTHSYSHPLSHWERAPPFPSFHTHTYTPNVDFQIYPIQFDSGFNLADLNDPQHISTFGTIGKMH